MNADRNPIGTLLESDRIGIKFAYCWNHIGIQLSWDLIGILLESDLLHHYSLWILLSCLPWVRPESVRRISDPPPRIGFLHTGFPGVWFSYGFLTLRFFSVLQNVAPAAALAPFLAPLSDPIFWFRKGSGAQTGRKSWNLYVSDLKIPCISGTLVGSDIWLRNCPESKR